MTLREEIEQLIAKWRAKAHHDAKHGVEHALRDQREYYGGVNAALAVTDCADELSTLLPKLASLAQEQREQKEKIAQLERERWWSKYPSGNHP